MSGNYVADPELVTVIKYIQDGVLSTDDKKAKELILGKTRYVCCDRQCVIPPVR